MMRRTKARVTLCSVFLIAILAFIWGNSAMPGEASGALSGWVGDSMSRFLPFLTTEAGLHLLRKAAHFSEFAALGLVLSWMLAMLAQRKICQFSLPFICGAAAACIDETIQIFSPGRYSSIIDVTIDCAGVWTGSLILLIPLAIIARRKTGSHPEG